MAYYASQCFPARNLLKFKQNADGGAWLVAYREEQRRRFDAVLCPDAKTEQRTKVQNARRFSPTRDSYGRKDYPSLSGIFLLKHMKVEDPSDLAYITISGKNLDVGKYEDFVLFDNVIHIEAGENNLSLETFRTFPTLRELELQLNNITSLSVTSNDFKLLEFLDLSYNSITATDILNLGMLVSLKRLHLTGNGLKKLPMEMARNYQATEGQEDTSTTKRRFQSLEVLYLDENNFQDISVFASLASLSKLRVLSLSKNNLQCVPHLLLASQPNKSHLIPYANNLEETNQSEAQDDLGSLQIMMSNDGLREAHDMVDEPVASSGDEPTELLNAVDSILAPAPAPDDDQREPKLENKDVSDIGIDFDTDLDLKLPGAKSDIKFENTLAADSSNFDSTDLDLSKEASVYPFQNLERLDLSYNQIAEEQALLPLAAFPSLVQVNVWENPLTKSCKGAPPLLNYHLTKLCGIALNRKEPKQPHKPAVGPAIAPVVRYNKVNDVMPPMRRKNMLMIEFESYEAALQNGSLYGQPLPPITPNKEERTSKDERESHSAPVRQKNQHIFVSNKTVMQRPHSVAADQFFGTNDSANAPVNGHCETVEENTSADNTENVDGVFLTQVDVNDEQTKTTNSAQEDFAKLEQPNLEIEDDVAKLAVTEQNNDECEALLQIEGPVEELDTPSADDLGGNIKALKHALKHPLVFTEPISQEEGRRTYTRHGQDHRVKSLIRSKRDKVDTALDNMRKQTNVIEENLDTVLQRYDTDPEMRRKFPEVKGLLKQVQSKYNEVRLASLENACTAQKILKRMDKHGDALSSTTRPPKANLVHSNDMPNNRRRNSGKNVEMRSVSTTKDVLSDSQDASAKMAKFKELVDKRI